MDGSAKDHIREAALSKVERDCRSVWLDSFHYKVGIVVSLIAPLIMVFNSSIEFETRV